MNDEIEMNPIDKLNELQNFLCETSFELHRKNDAGGEYRYLGDRDVCITVQNPYQEKEMFIDLTEEFTLTYGAFHSHYNPDLEDYKELVSDLQGILSNEICSAALYCHDKKMWLGSTSIAKSELTRPVRDIFCFVFRQAEFKKKLKKYGGEAQFCFWNPVDDCIVEVSKGL